MRSSVFAVAVLLTCIGCGGSGGRRNPGLGDDGKPPDPMPAGPNGDWDQDGYTPANGDCNDSLAQVNPAAVELPGNGLDDDCDGAVDEPDFSCDPTAGANDADSLARSFEHCDPRFFKSARFNGPSDARARKVVARYGVLQPLAGASMIALSTGVAADENDPAYVAPQPGTDFGASNVMPNPLPGLQSAPGCGGMATDANDYTELVLHLKAPSNVSSFSFQFHYLSSEYPEWVCSEFNDKFLVLMESKTEFKAPENIAFDMQGNPVTVNNGFFIICQNENSRPETQRCTRPVTELEGTGYEDEGGALPFPLPFPIPGGGPAGGSTGWLTTTVPVRPNDDIVLHFIVFDEGDHILDSAVLIDNFKWGQQQLDTPVTIQ
jgi:hypothetical protein